jgi:hypothetical protein
MGQSWGGRCQGKGPSGTNGLRSYSCDPNSCFYHKQWCEEAWRRSGNVALDELGDENFHYIDEVYGENLDDEEEEDFDENFEEGEDFEDENQDEDNVCRHSIEKPITAKTILVEFNEAAVDVMDDLDESSTDRRSAILKLVRQSIHRVNNLEKGKKIAADVAATVLKSLNDIETRVTRTSRHHFNKHDFLKSLNHLENHAAKQVARQTGKKDKSSVKMLIKNKPQTRSQLLAAVKKLAIEIINEEGAKLKGCGGDKNITPARARILVSVIIRRLKQLRNDGNISRYGFKHVYGQLLKADEALKTTTKAITIEDIRRFA